MTPGAPGGVPDPKRVSCHPPPVGRQYEPKAAEVEITAEALPGLLQGQWVEVGIIPIPTALPMLLPSPLWQSFFSKSLLQHALFLPRIPVCKLFQQSQTELGARMDIP